MAMAVISLLTLATCNGTSWVQFSLPSCDLLADCPVPGEDGPALLAKLRGVAGDIVLQRIVQGGSEGADIEMAKNLANDGPMRRELHGAFLGSAVGEDAHPVLRANDVLAHLLFIDRQTLHVRGEKPPQLLVRFGHWNTVRCSHGQPPPGSSINDTLSKHRGQTGSFLALALNMSAAKAGAATMRRLERVLGKRGPNVGRWTSKKNAAHASKPRKH
jgi:hypothetical protein